MKIIIRSSTVEVAKTSPSRKLSMASSMFGTFPILALSIAMARVPAPPRPRLAPPLAHLCLHHPELLYTHHVVETKNKSYVNKEPLLSVYVLVLTSYLKKIVTRQRKIAQITVRGKHEGEEEEESNSHLSRVSQSLCHCS